MPLQNKYVPIRRSIEKQQFIRSARFFVSDFDTISVQFWRAVSRKGAKPQSSQQINKVKDTLIYFWSASCRRDNNRIFVNNESGYTGIWKQRIREDAMLLNSGWTPPVSPFRIWHSKFRISIQLLAPQALHRIASYHPECMIAHRDKGRNQTDQRCDQEDGKMDGYSVGKILQPAFGNI